KGDAIPSSNLASKSFLDGVGQDKLIKITEEGQGGMPAFGSAKGGPLSRDQVTGIVLYLQGAAK
ncbi:MAG: cytochrome c, partial [Dehalococcoidia bacterium]|nr:cytochrome c [Dehalococcoidia bacterium]